MTTMRYRLTRALPICIALTLIPCIASIAQDETDSSNAPGRFDSHAFQIHFIGGMGVSYVNPLSDRSALRFSTGIDGKTTHRNGTSIQTGLRSDTVRDSGNADLSLTSSIFEINLAALYLRYVPLSNRTYAFIGAGPVGSYLSTSSSSSNVRHDTAGIIEQHIQSNAHEKEWGLGLRGTVGVQTFITQTISLLGEAQISGQHLWTENATQHRTYAPGSRVDLSENSFEGWKMDIDLARIGVGIHF